MIEHAICWNVLMLERQNGIFERLAANGVIPALVQGFWLCDTPFHE